MLSNVPAVGSTVNSGIVEHMSVVLGVTVISLFKKRSGILVFS